MHEEIYFLNWANAIKDAVKSHRKLMVYFSPSLKA